MKCRNDKCPNEVSSGFCWECKAEMRELVLSAPQKSLADIELLVNHLVPKPQALDSDANLFEQFAHGEAMRRYKAKSKRIRMHLESNELYRIRLWWWHQHPELL